MAIYLVIFDVIAVCGSFFVALWLRFDLKYTYIPDIYFGAWLKMAPYYAVFCILVFWAFKLYRSIWRFASFTELQRITIATAITTVTYLVAITLICQRMPISYYIIGPVLQYGLTVAVRFSYRFILLLRAKNRAAGTENCMLIGAGAAGTVVLRELQRSRQLKENVVCIIDDNPNKWHRDIDGVPIIGGRFSIVDAARKYDIKKIYIAIPGTSSLVRKDIIEICKQTDCELITLPGMYQLMLGKVTVNSLRKVDVEDLLGREPVKIGGREIREFLEDKTVLITGGGGSIGSEAGGCHQRTEAAHHLRYLREQRPCHQAGAEG